MRKWLEIGGLLAAIVLIAFGLGSIYMGLDGRGVVRDSLKKEQIVGSPDMTPAAIREEATKAGLKPGSYDVPSLAVANKPINSGDRARAFAGYMRIHTLEATGGQTYAQMPRFATDDGKGTNDPAQAAKGENGQPVSNAAREIWVTETALTTALNTSYMAEQLGLFALVVGVAFLLAGIGFGILAIGGALRNPETALGIFSKRAAKSAGAVIPTA